MEQCPCRGSWAESTRRCQPLSTAALLSTARAGPSTLSGFYKEQRREKVKNEKRVGFGFAGAAEAKCPCAPLSRSRRWRAGEEGLQPAAGQFFVCTSLIPWDGLLCRPCCRVLQAGGRRRWQSQAVPAIPQGRGPGRSGACGDEGGRGGTGCSGSGKPREALPPGCSQAGR